MLFILYLLKLSLITLGKSPYQTCNPIKNLPADYVEEVCYFKLWHSIAMLLFRYSPGIGHSNRKITSKLAEWEGERGRMWGEGIGRVWDLTPTTRLGHQSKFKAQTSRITLTLSFCFTNQSRWFKCAMSPRWVADTNLITIAKNIYKTNPM